MVHETRLGEQRTRMLANMERPFHDADIKRDNARKGKGSILDRLYNCCKPSPVRSTYKNMFIL
jgi:hypothetical protein